MFTLYLINEKKNWPLFFMKYFYKKSGYKKHQKEINFCREAAHINQK